MKVTHSWYGRLADFDAWDSGKDALDELVNTGFISKAESLAEDLWPDGVDEEELNDWLSSLEDDYPEWFNDNWDEMQEVKSDLDSKDRPLVWFTAADGDDVAVGYEDDDDDARVFRLTACWVETSPCGDKYRDSFYDIDYDFSKDLEENMEELKHRIKLEKGVYEKLADGLEYVEDFPTWAICYCMYGDATGISGADQKMVDEWMDENGYGELVSAYEETLNEFNRYPAFGLACGTKTVVMRKTEEKKDEA